MIRITVMPEQIEIKTLGDMSEVLKVKQLPGRYYDGDREAWIVPILPGLAAQLQEIYGGLFSGLIEDQEEDYMKRIAPPEPGTIDPFKIDLMHAVNLAVTHHFYAVHRGDRADYARVHYPFVIGE